MKHRVALVCLSLIAMVSPSTGITSPEDQTGRYQEEKEVPVDEGSSRLDTMVVVRVEVRDRLGKPVPGLRKGDFTLYENGAKRPVHILERGPSEVDHLEADQYRIGYIFRGRRDGTYRQVRVLVRKKGQPGLRVKSFPDGFTAREERCL